MPSSNVYNKKFAILTGLTLLFLALFVKLGFWQLARWHEKLDYIEKTTKNTNYKNNYSFNELKALKDHSKVKLNWPVCP